MARITHVKKAQQRYETVPVIDPATGVQKVSPVTAKDGAPKTTKRGKEIVRRLTVEDRSRPLPPRKCDSCSEEIAVGTPYKWIAPKSGPYGGTKRFRHESCPTWQVWEYSSSLSARISQVQHDFESSWNLDEVTTADEVTEALGALAEGIRELASEKREGAENIESGFGHTTYQSDELTQIADDLDSWADEIEQIDIPAEPEPEEESCDECSGTGQGDARDGEEPGDDGVFSEDQLEDCEQCEGTGSYTPEEPTEDQLIEWRTEVDDAVQSVVDACPV